MKMIQEAACWTIWFIKRKTIDEYEGDLNIKTIKVG